jgi:hypothetical protein
MAEETAQCGGCLCGTVRYRVSGPSLWRAICHCETCARAAGSLLIAWAGFPSAKFELLTGQLSIYESSPGVRRGFCGRCGTTLTYQKDPNVLPGFADDVYIATRTLDDPSAYPPEEHVHYRERPAWLEMGDTLPHHDSVSPAHAHRQLLGRT